MTSLVRHSLLEFHGNGDAAVSIDHLVDV